MALELKLDPGLCGGKEVGSSKSSRPWGKLLQWKLSFSVYTNQMCE